MQTKFKGILIYYKIYKENDLFIKFLSDTDEVISGIVYGGLSKKKRSIFQIGFYLNFDVSFKNNKPASINAELSEPFISIIINDKYKLNCIMSITSLINLSIIEGQKVKDIFKISNNFLLLMYKNKNWLVDYFIFLFQLLKIIGYAIDYSNIKKNKYFDIEKLEFKENYSKNTVEFPFKLLSNNIKKIELSSTNSAFKIFELVFTKHHLSNFNLRLPNQYHLFKKLIIERIKLI